MPPNRRLSIDPTINAYADAQSDIRAQDVRLTAEQRANQERYERLLEDMRALRADGRETVAEVRRVADELRRGAGK